MLDHSMSSNKILRKINWEYLGQASIVEKK